MELAQARITKVVVFFTTKPKKLGAHFSEFFMIFYKIYKNQESHFTIWVTKLQEGPRKEFLPCNAVPGGAAGAAPAKFRPGPAAGPVGDGVGVA
jgi:hypothetical protein